MTADVGALSVLLDIPARAMAYSPIYTRISFVGNKQLMLISVDTCLYEFLNTQFASSSIKDISVTMGC